MFCLTNGGTVRRNVAEHNVPVTTTTLPERCVAALRSATPSRHSTGVVRVLSNEINNNKKNISL